MVFKWGLLYWSMYELIVDVEFSASWNIKHDFEILLSIYLFNTRSSDQRGYTFSDLSNKTRTENKKIKYAQATN